MEKNEISNTKINFSMEPKYLYTLSCGSTNLKLYTDEMILGSEEDIVKKLLIKTLKNVYTFDVDEKDNNKIIFYQHKDTRLSIVGYYFEVECNDKKFLERLCSITNTKDVGCMEPIYNYSVEDLVDLFMEYFYKK